MLINYIGAALFICSVFFFAKMITTKTHHNVDKFGILGLLFMGAFMIVGAMS